MGPTSGKTDTGLRLLTVKQELKDHPYSFDFFQAVRLLHSLMPDRERVGGFAAPGREAVRFASNSSLAFPASEIQSLEWIDTGAPLMLVNFMGLTGPSGILPSPYSEFLIERLSAKPKDTAFEAFVNIFAHRMISLFYAAWERYRFPVRYESQNRDESFTRLWAALVGLGTNGLANRQGVSDSALLFYSGMLGLHSRSATALRDILTDYFGVPVEIDQFIGTWNRVDPSSQFCFQETGGHSEQLGISIILGDEVWDQNSRARIRLGPLTLEQFRRFLPKGSAYPAIGALVRFFSGNDVEFEIQLILRREDVPECELAGENDSPQLGWDTWMRSMPEFDRDPGDTILFLF